jgi:ATP-dependent Clp protease adaptor protein ClpS
MSRATPVPDVKAATKTEPRKETHTRRIPPYNVILENDDHHSMEFVIEVLGKALGYNLERAFQLMMQAHTSGRAVVWTGPKEVAELKADQIRSFSEIRERDGARLGPLGCSVEPAPGA